MFDALFSRDIMNESTEPTVKHLVCGTFGIMGKNVFLLFNHEVIYEEQSY